VLLLWGAGDRVFPAFHVENARTVIRDAEVVVVGEAGHAPQVEAPAAIGEALQQFLTRTDP
jgi:pimeloyl-ACP methyl ester carboxylesterase